jgi:hypothetical protein
MSSLERNIKPYSKAIVKLLKGAIQRNRNSNVWDDVVNYQTEIQDYISQIGLELIVKKEEGFAFVKQLEDSEGNTLNLVTRRQIGFETSIVLVVLRQSLEEFDSNPTQFQVFEKFITDSEIKEEVELDGYINNIVKLGYLSEVNKKENETKYQIQRIIKEKVTLDILQEFKLKLLENVESI